MTITQEISPLYKLCTCLPQSISSALLSIPKQVADGICEIRLRSDGVTGITIGKENCFLSSDGIAYNTSCAIHTSKSEIDEFLYKFCKGSIFNHESTLCDFFVVNDGIRVGIGAQAVICKADNISVSNISSLNIRIPRHIENCSDFLSKHIEKHGFPDGKGILIISSPGMGKTTVLRDLAKKLSDGSKNSQASKPRRVCVIDERHEIYMPKIFTNCCIDFLSGISKVKGIEIATRVLSPEIIICDEIAGPEEAAKIIQRKNSGVTFISSMHSDSFDGIISRDYVYKMFDEGVFGTACRLSRVGTRVVGEITEFKDVN